MKVSVRRNSIALVLLLLLLVGCRPKGVLSTSQMRDVLYDLHRADAVLQICGYNYGHDEAVAQYYHEVLASHGVTQAEFDSSLVWYTAHPTRFQRVYPRLKKRIEQDKERYLASAQDEERIEEMPHMRILPDSIPFPVDSVLDVYRHGLPVKWGKKEENTEKLHFFAEKFAYIK